MKYLRWLWVVLLGGWCGLQAQFIRADGRELVAADGAVFRIRGTNLGNWLVPEGYMWRLDGGAESPREIETLVDLLLGPDKAASFWHEYRDRYVSRADVEFLARIGCNTLRVPLHYRYFLEEHGEGFRLLDRLIEWCRASRVHLILDLHCAPGGQTGTNIDDSLGYPWLFESSTAQAQLVAVWEAIARHYSDEPTILGYDLLNEPLPAFIGLEKYKPLFEPLQRRVFEAVRAIDRNHVVFLTGVNWGSDFKVLRAPPGPNVAYTFHKYWMTPNQAAIREYVEFRDRYQVPIWCGETGENNDAWVAEFRQLLEANGVGWTFWPYKKMESTAGLVRFRPPAHWDRIVAFGKLSRSTGADRVKKTLPTRPAASEIETVFNELLQQIEFARCQPNAGYIRALGLELPR